MTNPTRRQRSLLHAFSSSLVIGTLLGCSAPSAATADRYAPYGVRSGGDDAHFDETVRATFDIDLVDANGAVLPTFVHRGRYYVMGDMGDRYAVRVRNPLGQRVEAVITVDGLDVIDGENGDLRKRGYIIEPYGDVTVDGFRTSMSDVATFRFSSVGGSYAGLKGKARNVGVIAVALFAEKQAPRPRPRPPVIHRPDYYGQGNSHDEVSAAPSAPRATASVGSGRKAEAEDKDSYGAGDATTETTAKRSRGGLGTEFGEQRYSSVSYGQFHRSASRPFITTEIRYNDRPGLVAAGVLPRPRPMPSETYLRETANPFPGDQAFARPPR